MSEHELRALPNVGPAVARTLLRLGITRPDDLRGQDGEQLYIRLCEQDGRRHDPCLLDTFVAIIEYVNGAPARPWWHYSRRRKAGAGHGSGAGRQAGAALEPTDTTIAGVAGARRSTALHQEERPS